MVFDTRAASKVMYDLFVNFCSKKSLVNQEKDYFTTTEMKFQLPIFVKIPAYLKPCSYSHRFPILERTFIFLFKRYFRKFRGDFQLCRFRFQL